MNAEEKRIKQKQAIEERKASCKEISVTEHDHQLCRELGYGGAKLKFWCDEGEGMSCLFCII